MRPRNLLLAAAIFLALLLFGFLTSCESVVPYRTATRIHRQPEQPYMDVRFSIWMTQESGILML